MKLKIVKQFIRRQECCIAKSVPASLLLIGNVGVLLCSKTAPLFPKADNLSQGIFLAEGMPKKTGFY